MIRSFLRLMWLRCEPIELGQTRTGLFVAAILVELWLLGRPVSATAGYITGSSEDQYIRIEWLYDLGDGYGIMSFLGRDDSPDGLMPTTLRELRFTTAGLTFDNVTGPVGSALDPPVSIGVVDGRTIYQYQHGPTSGIALFPIVPTPTVAVVMFPTEGVRLFDTEMDYSADLAPVLSAIIPVRLFGNTLDFVSIQTIPEPPAAVTLFAGAGAAAVATGRRRRESGERD